MAHDAFLFRLKAAQRDLISRCGGIERVAGITNLSKSQVGRWNDGMTGDQMPISAVIVLEEDCGTALVTAVMAQANGRRLSDPDELQSSSLDIMATTAAMILSHGEAMQSFAQAAADGHISPSEATVFDRKLSELEAALSRCRKATASARAKGGEGSGLKIVGE